MNFSHHKLKRRDRNKVRKILLIFASNDYFGDASNLLIRVVVENFKKVNLLEESEKMFEWCKMKQKEPSILRFNNWVKRIQRFTDDNVSDTLVRDLKKVEDFKKRNRKKTW